MTVPPPGPDVQKMTASFSQNCLHFAAEFFLLIQRHIGLNRTGKSSAMNPHSSSALQNPAGGGDGKGDRLGVRGGAAEKYSAGIPQRNVRTDSPETESPQSFRPAARLSAEPPDHCRCRSAEPAVLPGLRPFHGAPGIWLQNSSKATWRSTFLPKKAATCPISPGIEAYSSVRSA